MTERYRSIRLVTCSIHHKEFVNRCPDCVKIWKQDIKRMVALSRGGRPKKSETYGSLATCLKRTG